MDPRTSVILDVKSKKTPAECSFLSSIGPARRHLMHKEEGNPKAKDRLLAYAMRKEGTSVVIG